MKNKVSLFQTLFSLFIFLLLPEAETFAQSSGNCSNNPTFRRTYGGNKSDVAQSFIFNNDSSITVVGSTRSYGSGGQDAYIQKTNRQGDVVWSRAIGGAGDDEFTRIIRTQDGGFAAAGSTKSYGGGSGGLIWLVKFSAAGAIEWSSTYTDGSGSGTSLNSVIQTADNGFVLCGIVPFTPGLANGIIIKTNSTGVIQWYKIFDSADSDQITSVIEDGNAIVATGIQYGQSQSYYDGILMKLNSSDGAVQWTRSFEIAGRSNWFYGLQKNSTGYTMASFESDDFGNTNPDQLIITTDVNGQNAVVRRYTSSPVQGSGDYSITPDGGIIMFRHSLDGNNDLLMHKISSTGTVQWSRRIGGAGVQSHAMGRPNPWGGYTIVGYNNSTPAVADSTELLIIQTDSVGLNPGCTTGTSGITITTISASINNSFAWSNITSTGVSSAAVTPASVNATPQVRTECYQCINNVISSTNDLRRVISSDRILSYPNPTNGNFYIDVKAAKTGVISFSITDISGRLVYRNNYTVNRGDNLIRIDAATYINAAGSYVFTLVNGNTVSSGKILVVK